MRFGFLAGTALALILTASTTASAAPQNSNQCSAASRRARLQHAGQHAEAVNDDGRRHPLPRHAAGFEQHADTIAPPASIEWRTRACKARGNSQADDRAGAGPRRGGARDVVAPPEPSPNRAAARSRCLGRSPRQCPRPSPSPRPVAAPAPARRVGGSICRRARSRCASGLLTAQARRRGSTRGQCRDRGRSRQQASRDHHRQAVRPRRRAQARPRRDRRALPEGPQLPAAVGRPRRGERARQGRDRISAAPSTPTASIRRTTGCRSSTSAAPRSRRKPS